MTYLLIVYLYAKIGYSGGPVLAYQPMPSLEACETAGNETVRLATNDTYADLRAGPRFSCIRVSK